MEQKTNILIVGGGPAAIVCAITARKYYPEKKILMIRDKKDGDAINGFPLTASV